MVGVPFWPNWAWRPGCVQFFKMLLFIILGRFCKIGVPPRREAHVRCVGLSLGGSRGPFLAIRSQSSEAMCSGSGGCSRRVSAPPTLTSSIIRGDLLLLGSCSALGRRPFLAKMGLALRRWAQLKSPFFQNRHAPKTRGPPACLLVALELPSEGSRDPEGGHRESCGCFAVWPKTMTDNFLKMRTPLERQAHFDQKWTPTQRQARPEPEQNT